MSTLPLAATLKWKHILFRWPAARDWRATVIADPATRVTHIRIGPGAEVEYYEVAVDELEYYNDPKGIMLALEEFFVRTLEEHAAPNDSALETVLRSVQSVHLGPAHIFRHGSEQPWSHRHRRLARTG